MTNGNISSKVLYFSVNETKDHNLLRHRFSVFLVIDFNSFGFVSITKYAKLWDIDLILAPSFLGAVMHNAGNQPPATNPFKGRYMLEDIKVGSSLFGTKQLRIPKGFPGNSLQAQRILTALKLKVPHKLIQVSLDFWDAYWICGKPLTDDTFAEILQRNLENASEIMQLSQHETVKKELIDTTKEAMTAGAFGFPWFVCEKDGQKHMFFGSDRLEAMAHWLQLPYYGANPKSKL